MTTAIKREKDKVSVRQFNCSSCGNALTMHNTRANYITCQYCGSQLDGNSDAHDIINKVGDPKKVPYKSFIRLGMTAEFEGMKVRVVARTCWKSNYKEWYTDSDGSGYSNEVWRYDEWLLVSEQGTYHYLIDDKEGFYLSERFIPSKPALPDKSLRWSMENGRPPKQIQEFGSAMVEHFEGESTYKIIPGDEVRFAMYKDRGYELSVEYRISRENPNEITEIEFFQDRRIPDKTVFKAFGNNEAVQALTEKKDKEKHYRNLFGVAAIVFFILMIVGSASEGKEVVNEYVAIKDLQDEAPYELGPWKFDDAAPVHTMRWNLAGELPDNSEIWVGIEILENDEVIFADDAVYSRWTGYDDEGYWQENNYSHSKDFKVDKDGSYTAKIYADSDVNTAFSSNRLHLTVHDGGQTILWYILLFIGSLITMIVFHFRFKRLGKG